jgi:hypothetical protein
LPLEQARDKEKQRQEEPQKQPAPNQKQQGQSQEKPAKPQNPQQGPLTRQQKPAERNQPNRSNQQPPPAARSNVRRIPPDKFQSNFGIQHHFHIEQLEGRRFHHGGFVFEIVEAWPADWSSDADCYIEQDANDYYLLDAFHPGARILLIVIG